MLWFRFLILHERNEIHDRLAAAGERWSRRLLDWLDR